MSVTTLIDFSNHLADIVERTAVSVVQVHGRKRPASGVVFGPDRVVTTARALGAEQDLRVRTHTGETHGAELRGWDPATGIAVLQVPSAVLPPPLSPGDAPLRTGHLLVGVARSWSNNVTATSGIVAVMGGPLPTGPGRAVARVIRTTAPMHSGYAGGAALDASGRFIGLATAAAIRGLAVVIPADIVTATADHLVQHGTPRRGYLGIAGQSAALPDRQRERHGRSHGLLIVGVAADSPADHSGLLVGDVMIDFDGHEVRSPVDLLGLLDGERIGRPIQVRVLRGDAVTDAVVTVTPRAQP